MNRKLFKSGGGYATNIPKSWLDILGWDVKTLLKFELDINDKKIKIGMQKDGKG